jgi:ribosomal protein S18 acetylase RimI-like enzyme
MVTYPLRKLTLEDIPAAMEHSKRIGWTHTTSDWEHAISWGNTGAYCIEHPDEKTILAIAAGHQYGKQRGWLHKVITHPDYRGRGFGGQLVQTVVDRLREQGVREIMLDASGMGLSLYEKLGFRTLYTIDTFFGVLSSKLPAESDSRIRPMTLDDLPAAAALDEIAFGAARPHVLEDMLRNGIGWLEIEAGEVKGCLIASKTQPNYAHVGPWIHPSPAGAERLWKAALPELAELEVRVDAAETNELARQLALAAGLQHIRSTKRMILGDVEPIGETSAYHGAASLAFG